MKIDTFKKLPESILNKPKIGYMFLEGEYMIKQKHTKNIGDSITYFEVISASESNYEYMPKYEKLEK